MLYTTRLYPLAHPSQHGRRVPISLCWRSLPLLHARRSRCTGRWRRECRRFLGWYSLWVADCGSIHHNKTATSLTCYHTAAASFFLTQFATALLWASAAARYGRRTVLFVSLLGNTLMLLLYGTSRSVVLMVMVRMFQGAFNGAVGVARSAVKDITDSTNEGRAYSIIGLAWSLGGILGPAVGGWCVDTRFCLSLHAQKIN